MGLINVDEIAKAIKLDKLGVIGKGISYSLYKILKLDKINDVYNKNKKYEGVDFLTNLLNDFEIKFEIHEEDLRRIPKDGAFISISNHPLGALDGILLLKLLLEKRSDFKVMGNFLLQKIEPMKDMVVPVNPFENHKDSKIKYKWAQRVYISYKGRTPTWNFSSWRSLYIQKRRKINY